MSTRAPWRARRWCARAWLAVLSSGCDGLGRPIVDHLAISPSSFACPDEPPDCSAAAPTPAAIVATPLTLAPCRADPASCPGQLASDGAMCELSWELAPGFAPPQRDLRCVKLALRADAPATVNISGLSAQDAAIAIQAAQPMTLELTGAQLTRTTLALEGPISVRFAGESALSAVYIQGGEASSELELSDLRASAFELSDFAGTARVARAALRDVKLIAQQVSIEVASFTGLALKAERLSAVELHGSDLALDVRRASMAELDVSKLQLARCGALLLASSLVRDSLFLPCTDDPLRVDQSQIFGSMVLGGLVGRWSLWDHVRFGAGSGTEGPAARELWHGSVRYSSLCAGVSAMSFGATDPLACNACDGLIAPEQALCAAPADDGAGPTFEPIPYWPALTPYQNPQCPPLDALRACDPPPLDALPL